MSNSFHIRALDDSDVSMVTYWSRNEGFSPGLGDVSQNYAGLSAISKLGLCFAMILGRLEIFTLLVILTPAFWRN